MVQDRNYFWITSRAKLVLVQNKILLCAKYYIYKCRINKQVASLNMFEKDINYLYKTERFIAIKRINWKILMSSGIYIKLLPPEQEIQ